MLFYSWQRYYIFIYKCTAFFKKFVNIDSLVINARKVKKLFNHKNLFKKEKIKFAGL